MTDTPRRWTLEDLLDGRGQRGQAEADARFSGNASARQAINELSGAVRALEAEFSTHGDDAA